MKSKTYILVVMCFSLGIAACSNDDDDNNAGNDDDDAAVNELAIIGALTADEAPAAITAKLETDIISVFGEADNNATDVVTGDTVQTVIDRATEN